MKFKGEKPILFSAPMVLALMRDIGAKTQTRRVNLICRPGDRLWVRETFSGPHSLTGIPPREWPQDAPIWYWADGEPTAGDWTKPKPGIHMPRWASRTLLEVATVESRKLQSLSEADALAEGIERIHDTGPGGGPNHFSLFDGAGWTNFPTAQEAFAFLWDQLNGHKPDVRWAADPFVWRYLFSRVKP